MDYKNSDLPWCANCIYGVPEENGNNIYCKQIEGWRIEDDFCGLHEWRNTIIRGIVEGKGNMDFKMPLHIAKEIKKYCEQQDFGDDENKETCRYCVFCGRHGDCMLHDDKMGFPSDWKTP